MDLIFITNDITRASVAQAAGVDWIMVDLEINGKDARQGHLNTVISRHTAEDVRRVRSVLTQSRLLVRINPLFEGSAAEIEECIAAEADILMLPMFTRAEEVARFVDLVGGRAKTCLLLETPQAFVRADQIARCRGVDAVHVGLNDLHLGMGLSFMFELLSHGQVEQLAAQFIERGVKFGFGGVARINTGALSSGLILSEHVRLNSTQVILSRDFQRIFETSAATATADFNREIGFVRNELSRLARCTADELKRNSAEIRRVVSKLVAEKGM